MGRNKTVLWWGRFDPDYSRNRILRKLLVDMGWQVRDFHPHLSRLGNTEANLRGLPRADLVWVPCFRQRDLLAARKWSRRHGVPLLFDPLISAYDKQTAERGRVPVDSRAARKILYWERGLFQSVDLLLADTQAHADYFSDVLGVSQKRLSVVYVGAEETLFQPMPMPARAADEPLEVLFYGSFIPLQGPEVVVEAARKYQGPPVKWTMLGDGPLRRVCEGKAKGLVNVNFENWLPYRQLPDRIRQVDIMLGIFGTSMKAGRVIPNKVYQSLACGRPVITRASGAYPGELASRESPEGLIWCAAGDADSLARQVSLLASSRHRLQKQGDEAASISRKYFSYAVLRDQLASALDLLPLGKKAGGCGDV